MLIHGLEKKEVCLALLPYSTYPVLERDVHILQ